MGCSTWLGTYGNGWRIGMEKLITGVRRCRTRPVRPWGSTACYAVALGTAMWNASVLPIAVGTIPIAGTAFSVFVVFFHPRKRARRNDSEILFSVILKF